MSIILLCYVSTSITYAATTLGVTNTNIISNGLVGYWSFDGKDMYGTTAYDRSSLGNNGTLTGVKPVIGKKVGQAISLTDSNSVSFGNASNLNAYPLTISLWMKTTDSSAGVLTKYVSASDNGYSLHIVSGHLYFWYFKSPGNYVFPGSGSGVDAGVINDGNWHHVVLVVNASGGFIYVDNVLKNSRAWTGTPGAPTQTQPLQIGVTNGGYNGLEDDIRIYNRALSTTEITTLYNDKVIGGVTQISASRTGLVGYWPFDYSNVYGTTARDVSVYGNNATLVNGPTIVAGKRGQAMQFDGVDDYAVFSTIGQATNNFSFGAWVKTSTTHEIDAESTVTTTGVTGQKYVFDPRNKGTNAGAGFSVGTNGISVYEHGDSYMPPTAVYNGSIGTSWNHIFVVYINKRSYIYLNGALVRTGLTSPKSLVYSPEYVAGGGTPYGPFAGLVDDARIYNRALSAAEIQKIYNQAQVTNGVSLANAPGLVSHWTFDGKNMTNATATDSSGSGNDGSLTNMTTNGSAVIGKIGQGLKLDGVNDYITVAGSPTVQNVSYWIKPTASKYLINLSHPSTGSQNYFTNSGLYSGTTTATRYINGAIPTSESLGSELITDGTAESGGTDNWNSYFEATHSAAGTEAVTASSPYGGTYSFDVNITNAGNTNNNDVQFGSVVNYFSVTSGSLYKVQFAVKGSTNFSGAGANILMSSSPWTASSLEYTYNITTSWVLHTFYFYAVRTGTSDNKINFRFGNSNTGHVYFDNISVKPVNSVGGVTNNSWNFVSVNLSDSVAANNIKLGKIGSNYFIGDIDDVRFYNRLLSVSEIQGLYKLGTR